MLLRYFYVICQIFIVIEGKALEQETVRPKQVNQTINARRILQGQEAGDTRPYMVYLRPAKEAQVSIPNWLCGGVIIHEHYILTSAACIEDVNQFYVVSGTHKWVPIDDIDNNECIKQGALRAILKCVPMSYKYDGKDFDNYQWMNDDIAIVKVEDDFNFEKRVKGCDFIPKKIAYNNISKDLEKPDTVSAIAGWGSVGRFADVLGLLRESPENSPNLLEADTVIISKKSCKKRWPERYHQIIDKHMICTRSSVGPGCEEADLFCQQLTKTENDESPDTRRHNDQESFIHTAAHADDGRRSKTDSGGFCENDHGGPLITGHGTGSVVTGIISACQSRPDTRACYGPFLYTSVWNHRHMIDCAIEKDIGSRRSFSDECQKVMKSSRTTIKETHFHWNDSGRKNQKRRQRIYESDDEK